MQNGCASDKFNILKTSFEMDRKQVFQLAAAQYGDGNFIYSYMHGNIDLFPLWFLYITMEYIKETGRFDVLDETLPFIGKSYNIHYSKAYGSVLYKPGESPLYYHLEYAYDTFFKQMLACGPVHQLKPENLLAAGLFSFIGKDYVKLSSYTDMFFGALLATKKLKQFVRLFNPILAEVDLQPYMQDFLSKKECRCNKGPVYRKCFCEEIHQFIKSHLLGIMSLSSKKSASEYWLNTASAWNEKETSEWIMGIKPGFDGLYVDPCIPDSLDVFETKRYFRNALYKISVTNPLRSPVEIQKLVVDQIEYLGNLLPNFSDGKLHTAEVVMGHFQ